MTNSKWLAAALCAALVPHHAAAQSWPTKPVRFLTGFGVGGSSDQLARMPGGPRSKEVGFIQDIEWWETNRERVNRHYRKRHG